MYRKAIRVALASVSILIAGCAQFRAYNVPVIQQNESQAFRAKKVKVFSYWRIKEEGQTWTSRRGSAVSSDDFETALVKSGCCEIAKTPSEATLLINGTVDIDPGYANNPFIVKYFAFLTMYTIPTWGASKTRVSMTVTDGENSKVYILSDSFTEVVWLPFLFVSPFTDSQSKVWSDMKANLDRAFVIMLKKDGYL